MDNVEQPAGGAAPLDVPDDVVDTVGGYDKNIKVTAWKTVGTYEERVGFDATDNLYPRTFLYFAKRVLDDRSLLSYTLADRAGCELGVDDGCIELRVTAGGIDVVTTKSLYVKGTGADTEVGGILAYIAVYSGWGTQTLALVANAAGV